MIRRVQQASGTRDPTRTAGFWETSGSVWRARGWRGFYVGLGLSYVKIVPMTAVSYAVWQWIKRVLDQ